MHGCTSDIDPTAVSPSAVAPDALASSPGAVAPLESSASASSAALPSQVRWCGSVVVVCDDAQRADLDS